MPRGYQQLICAACLGAHAASTWVKAKMRKVVATRGTLEQVRQVTVTVFGKFTTDMARNCFSHFFRDEGRFAARGGIFPNEIIPTALPANTLEAADVEDDPSQEEEVEIFASDPNRNNLILGKNRHGKKQILAQRQYKIQITTLK